MDNTYRENPKKKQKCKCNHNLLSKGKGNFFILFFMHGKVSKIKSYMETCCLCKKETTQKVEGELPKKML